MNYGIGDVIEKYKMCPSPNSKNVFPIGMKTIMTHRIISEDKPGHPGIKTLQNGSSVACGCCFRLFIPPTPESAAHGRVKEIDIATK